MSKMLITALVLAAVGMAGIVAAEAKPVWVYPYKGTPYVLPEGHAKKSGALLRAKPAISYIPSRSASFGVVAG